MYAARLIAVSLSVFVLAYAGLSLAVVCAWRKLWSYVHNCSRLQGSRHSAQRAADFLFGLRLLPWLAAMTVTVVFTAPSFVLLEPRSIDERIGIAPVLLTVCGFVLAALGLVNAAWGLRRASRAITAWMCEGRLLESQGKANLVRISGPIPALTAVGILKPRILMSEAAEFLLTEKELRTALRHELAHVRRRDNLKKLLLRVVVFPGMARLETAWLEATELAADDAAVFSSSEALDLAAALIKLSRLAAATPPIDLTAALVHRPAAVMNARVERLIAWRERPRVSSNHLCSFASAGVGLLAIAGLALTYGGLLIHVHAATEWLVR